MNFDERLNETVNRVGWMVVSVPEDEEGAAFAFTVGLHRTFAHPEILMMGQKSETMHAALNTVGDLVKAGNRFVDEAQSKEIFNSCVCMFRSIHRAHFSEYLGAALGFYKEEHFGALQCLWPDRNGFYPGQTEFNEHLAKRQIALFNVS